jgi:hypothetical protein
MPRWIAHRRKNKSINAGDRFGRLTVIGPGEPRLLGKRKAVFQTQVCLCTCGKTHVVLNRSLVSGKAKSCGCLRQEVMAQQITSVIPPAPGMKNGNWKGGRHVDGRGYINVRIEPDDPMFVMHRRASFNGVAAYVFEHRLVMARYLGRPLQRHEDVHHINGARADNRIENLQLRIRPHGSGQVFRCGDCGSCNVVPVALALET